MKRLIILFILFFSAPAYSEQINLKCSGNADQTKSGSIINHATGAIKGINTRESSYASITLSINDDNGWIQIPETILPPIKSKKPGNKYELKKIKISEGLITAKFSLNVLNNPKMQIDRYTGVMSFKGLGISYNGNCKKVDLSKKKF